MDELNRLIADGLTAAFPTVQVSTPDGFTFEAVQDVSRDRGRERRTLLWTGPPHLTERDVVIVADETLVLSEPRRDAEPVHVVVRRG